MKTQYQFQTRYDHFNSLASSSVKQRNSRSQLNQTSYQIPRIQKTPDNIYSYKKLYNKVNEELQNLKRKVESTYLAEVEIQLIVYKNECGRLKKLLQQESLNQEKSEKANYIKNIEMQNENLVLENNKMKLECQRFNELVQILKYKVERNEMLVLDMKHKNKGRLSRDSAYLKQISEQSYNSHNTTSNEKVLKLRIQQKENKINSLEQAIRSQTSSFREAQQNSLQNKNTDILFSTIFYKIKLQLIKRGLTLNEFYADVMQDKEARKKLNVFNLKQNLKRGELVKDLSNEEFEFLINYLSEGQIFIVKEQLIKKIDQFISSKYEDLINLKKQNKLADQVKIIQEVFQYSEIYQKAITNSSWRTEIKIIEIRSSRYSFCFRNNQHFNNALQKYLKRNLRVCSTQQLQSSIPLIENRNSFKSLLERIIPRGNLKFLLICQKEQESQLVLNNIHPRLIENHIYHRNFHYKNKQLKKNLLVNLNSQISENQIRAEQNIQKCCSQSRRQTQLMISQRCGGEDVRLRSSQALRLWRWLNFLLQSVAYGQDSERLMKALLLVNTIKPKRI